MPTGYTAPVGDGEITEFADFAKRCARAFGALVHLRDQPMDAPLPEKPESISSYHDTALASARRDLVAVKAMSHEECANAAEAEHGRLMHEWRERRQKRELTRSRYEAMLRHVRAWEPPTPDHTGLKEFMIEQLKNSIDFDCSHSFDEQPVLRSVEDWRFDRIRKLNRDVDYHTEERAKAIERAKSRHKWLTDLLDSLGPGAA